MASSGKCGAVHEGLYSDGVECGRQVKLLNFFDLCVRDINFFQQLTIITSMRSST